MARTGRPEIVYTVHGREMTVSQATGILGVGRSAIYRIMQERMRETGQWCELEYAWDYIMARNQRRAEKADLKAHPLKARAMRLQKKRREAMERANATGAWIANIGNAPNAQN